MTTVRENISQLAKQITDLFTVFLTEHSSIYLSHEQEPYSAVFWAGPDHTWKDLSPEGRKIQSRLLQDFQMFCVIVKALLGNQSKDTLDAYGKLTNEVSEILEQNGTTWYETTKDALSKGVLAIQAIEQLIDRLYSASSDDIFVPDSNAVIVNPTLEKWAFPGSTSFTIIFTPALLSELDELKVNHRNENVRAKAEQVIRQIKEYRRRGNLSTGVPIVSNKILARSIATEPDFKTTLPWLDPNNSDDRIIASTIEIMRANTAARVTIVSGDVNLQNKADFARIPCCEPPIS